MRQNQVGDHMMHSAAWRPGLGGNMHLEHRLIVVS